MQSFTKFFIFVCLTTLATVCFAQQAEPQASAAEQVAEASIPDFPYIAQISGDSVNVRSGPGTNYYASGKLNKADRVKIVGSQFSWSHIVPPPGSFSWISKQYISIDTNNDKVGIVTGDAVRVYAGSEDLKPIHSTTLQLKLGNGDKVALLGIEQGGYYKITPPDGAYLWVSTKYTEPIGPVGEVAPAVETEPEVKAEAPVEVVEKQVDADGSLKEYYALEKQVKAERAKEMAKQDYTKIKEALGKLAEGKETDKTTRYATFALEQIKGYELALMVEKVVALQDAQLHQVKEKIAKARAVKIASVPDMGRFAVVGKFEISSIYTADSKLTHYRIINNSGKILCYAMPSFGSESDLGKFVGRKVGLIGTIEPHPQTAGALVRFTEIIELE